MGINPNAMTNSISWEKEKKDRGKLPKKLVKTINHLRKL